MQPVGSRTFSRSFIIVAVLVVMLASMAAVSAQPTSPTTPVTQPSVSPFVGDNRLCSSLPGVYAQTAAIYLTGPVGSRSFLLYEVNDQGVGTFLDTVSRQQIDEATDEAQDSSEPALLFSAPTYTVEVLPTSLCRFTSLQIPTAQGKPFTCTFICN